MCETGGGEQTGLGLWLEEDRCCTLRALGIMRSSASRRWKLRWQPQAAHLSEVGSERVAVGEVRNSPQPSRARPPMLAAWFLRHSL